MFDRPITPALPVVIFTLNHWVCEDSLIESLRLADGYSWPPFGLAKLILCAPSNLPSVC